MRKITKIKINFVPTREALLFDNHVTTYDIGQGQLKMSHTWNFNNPKLGQKSGKVKN